jgi:hypothetical protein
MRDYNFKIKLSDFFAHPQQRESLSFKQKFSSLLPDLTEQWLSATITIQWLDEKTVLLIIENLKATREQPCDWCLKNTEVTVHVPTYQVKSGYFEEAIIEEEDNIIPLSGKEDQVDLEKELSQSILVQRNVVNLCLDCQKKRYEKLDQKPNDIATHGVVRIEE